MSGKGELPKPPGQPMGSAAHSVAIGHPKSQRTRRSKCAVIWSLQTTRSWSTPEVGYGLVMRTCTLPDRPPVVDEMSGTMSVETYDPQVPAFHFPDKPPKRKTLSPVSSVVNNASVYQLTLRRLNPRKQGRRRRSRLPPSLNGPVSIPAKIARSAITSAARRLRSSLRRDQAGAD